LENKDTYQFFSCQIGSYHCRLC